MKFKSEVYIMPLTELLDPQGKAVLQSLQSQGAQQFEDVRIGKRIELSLEADSTEAATQLVETACKDMLHNPVMETYSYTVEEVK